MFKQWKTVEENKTCFRFNKPETMSIIAAQNTKGGVQWQRSKISHLKIFSHVTYVHTPTVYIEGEGGLRGWSNRIMTMIARLKKRWVDQFMWMLTMIWLDHVRFMSKGHMDRLDYVLSPRIAMICVNSSTKGQWSCWLVYWTFGLFFYRDLRKMIWWLCNAFDLNM